MGKEKKKEKRIDINTHICTTESLCSTLKTNNNTPIKKIGIIREIKS